MRFSQKHTARVALAGLGALLTLALAAPSWGGQVNLSSRLTSISETITSVDSGSGGPTTISATQVIESITTSGIQTITRSVQISEVFSAASAAVSFEVAQDNLNYTSPFDNLVITSGITQTVNVLSVAGLTNVQITGGAGNVSVASNGVLDGVQLFSITGTLSGTTVAGATEVAALALTPGFALQNSNANALTLAAAVAIAGAGGSGGAAALDIQQSGVNEYSPHGNLALVNGTITQSVNVSATGITNVGVQAGAGNVQAAHTVILFGTLNSIGTILGP